MLKIKNKKERLKTNLHHLLRDDLFWAKFKNAEPSQSFIARMASARSRVTIPRKDALINFIDTYRYITKDDRSDKDIMLWLLSDKED